MLEKLMKFQFTPLREGRQTNWMVRMWPCCFNSRPCERGDENVYGISK